jgi:hypothetical protein
MKLPPPSIGELSGSNAPAPMLEVQGARRIGRGRGAAIMGSIRRKPLTAFFRRGLTLLSLTVLPGPADAGQKLLPSEQFPGPWPEVTQEIRDVLVLNRVSACSQAVGRQSSRNSGEYLLYCTTDEKLWTSWRVQSATLKVCGPGKPFDDIAPPDSY